MYYIVQQTYVLTDGGIGQADPGAKHGWTEVTKVILNNS